MFRRGESSHLLVAVHPTPSARVRSIEEVDRGLGFRLVREADLGVARFLGPSCMARGFRSGDGELEMTEAFELLGFRGVVRQKPEG